MSREPRRHDDTSQLTGVSGARSESYSYDENGNRTMTGYVTGANNRLLQDADWTYEYDDEGNLIKKTSKASPYNEWHYTWDHRNRLVEATLKPHEGVGVLKSVRFTYDVFDRRIQKLADTNGDGLWDSGYKTLFDGDNPYMDFSLTNNLLARYLYGDEMDELYGKVYTGGEVDWYMTDLLGSVRYVKRGYTTVAEMHYDSFGNQLLPNDPDLGRFRYTAREWDAETGLQFNRARYYDPQVGQWLSEDPIKFKAGDTNLYRYVHNNPTTYRDPTGFEGEGFVWEPDWLDRIGGYFLGPGSNPYSKPPILRKPAPGCGSCTTRLGSRPSTFHPTGLEAAGAVGPTIIQLGAQIVKTGIQVGVNFIPWPSIAGKAATGFGQLAQKFLGDPSKWKVVGQTFQTGTRRGARKCGFSVETVFEDPVTRQRIVHHAVVDDAGKVVDNHFRGFTKQNP